MRRSTECEMTALEAAHMQTLCMQLGSFATLILNFVPAVEKTLSLWIQSLMPYESFGYAVLYF